MSGKHFDVIVVGGGPAGSTAAWSLGRKGLRIAVVDKADFPRDKVCAGWITPPVVEALELDTADYGRGRVFQPIDSMRTSRLGDPDVLTAYDRPVSYGIRRCEFDHYLLERSGATLVTGEPVRDLTRTDGLWRLGGAVNAPMLVGAGGHFCPVARHIGNRVGADERIVAAHEVEFEMSADQAAGCGVRGETPELFFCRDLKGYGWVFRKGRVLNVGLGREDNHNLARHVEDFTRYLKGAGKVPQDMPDNFRGHAYILYGHTNRHILDHGVVLVGDAAGLAYAQSGEGIRPAVESALLAAEVIAQAAGDYRRGALDAYRQALNDRFGPPVGDAARWVPEKVRQFLAGKLLGNPSFARRVVLDRWFFHAHQAALTPAA